MKVINLFKLYVIFFFVSISIIGCSKDNGTSKIVTMSVAPDPVALAPGPPAASNSPATIDNMIVTEDETNQSYYLGINQIEGFNYETGYTYKLKVRITPIANPPADGSSLSYSLISVVTKIKK